jgi:phoH family protein
MDEVKLTIEIENPDMLAELFGQRDENVRVIEDETGVRISMQEGSICISGQQEQAEVAQTVVRRLMLLLARRERIDKTRIRYAIELAAEGRDELIDEIMSDVVAITYRGKQIRAKTLGQSRYVNAMKNNTVVFGVGPAGTGKTYLAMAAAVMAFKNKEVSRIVLTRPAVEAGEKLGFLPGDLQHKVDPYLRPLYDAIYEMMGSEAYARLAERGVIEVAPLEYMRGRTLSDAYIILDEAQNTTNEQMKMFLTRLGEGSKAVVTGDLTQIDLPPGKVSGLKRAVNILEGVKDIAVCHFSHKDVVRHELVQSIIKAYESFEKHEKQ